jgi:hypothetical protein
MESFMLVMMCKQCERTFVSPNEAIVHTCSESSGTQPTDVQQLKTEIAALANEHFFTNESGTSCSGKYSVIAKKLRQLSAV